MASVRIESKALNTDVRFDRLAKRTGFTREDAVCRMAYLWAYCAEHETYTLDEETIDIVSRIPGFHKMIVDPRVDLGVRDGDKIYIRGTEGRIEWLHKKRKAAKKGGKIRVKKAKRNPDGTFQKSSSKTSKHESSHQLELADHPPSSAVVVVNPASNPVIASENYSVGEPASPPPAPGNEIQRFIGVYVKAFQKKFPADRGGQMPRPYLGGKVQGQIKQFLAEVPFQRACELIQVYLQMDDPWFEKKAFDFTTFKENLQKISLALDTGRQVRAKTAAEEWVDRQKNSKALEATQ